jgi:hypothetical protein
LPISTAAHRSCSSSMGSSSDDGLTITLVRRNHRAKESDPRAQGNNPQLLREVPNAILTYEFATSQ